MDKKVTGAWIVHHGGKLNHVTPTGQFETIAMASKAGVLLSALSTSVESELSPPQVEAFAKAAGIHTKLELPLLLGILESERLVARSASRIQTLGLTSANVLTNVADIFQASNPAAEERASLEMAEIVSNEPKVDSDLAERIGDSFQLAKSEVKGLFQSSEFVGFIDAEPLDSGSRLFFNGNLFRRGDAAKIQAVLSSLSSADHSRIQEIDVLLRQRGCLELGKVRSILTKGLLEKLRAIGFYDINELANSIERVYYVTRPAAFGKFGDPFVEDALDLAKAFVACLSYGMTRRNPATGRITMLRRLVSKLLAGEWVGPATAIGEDYRVLELKRVIATRSEGSGMYSMRLLKREVGELALQVLTEGDASEQALSSLPSAAAVRYASPERARERVRRRQLPASRKATTEILRAIRTGGQ